MTDAERPIAPLRRVEHVAVSQESGTALNPRYFWLTWEYTLSLDCGHVQVRARCVYKGSPAPANLRPALPARVRCADCPATPSASRKPRPPKRAPMFDPVVGALVAAMCKAVPAEQDALLEWVERHGRYVADEASRSRAYGAMALLVIDSYLSDTRNAHAAGVRDAVALWALEPTQDNREQVRKAARRLYGAQHRDGDWYAHRGILDAAGIASPAPHSIRSVLACPTWDGQTRSEYYSGLWTLRHRHDAVRVAEAAALLADDADRVRGHNAVATRLREEAARLAQTDQPVVGAQHLTLVKVMLATYRGAFEGDALGAGR